MRDMTKLKRLAELKQAADKINAEIAQENSGLTEERDRLAKATLDEFLEELKELSKYGSAGATGYYFNYIGEKCQIYHEATENGFNLTYWLPGAGYRAGEFDELYSYGDKFWRNSEHKKIKEYIIHHKDEILDRAEKLIAENLSASIADSSVVDENRQLKADIDALSRKGEKYYDIESGETLSREDLEREYEYLYKNGETETSTFEGYLQNCLSKNGTLERRREI